MTRYTRSNIAQDKNGKHQVLPNANGSYYRANTKEGLKIQPNSKSAYGGARSQSTTCIQRKKGGGREASPFSVQAYGSVPSTGQRRPGLPRADPAVLSARWGLASGFGTGPGVPPMLWPLTGGRRPPLRCPGSHSTRALGAAWRIGEVTRGHPRARTARERMSRGPRGAVPEELGRLVRLG